MSSDRAWHPVQRLDFRACRYEIDCPAFMVVDFSIPSQTWRGNNTLSSVAKSNLGGVRRKTPSFSAAAATFAYDPWQVNTGGNADGSTQIRQASFEEDDRERVGSAECWGKLEKQNSM